MATPLSWREEPWSPCVPVAGVQRCTEPGNDQQGEPEPVQAIGGYRPVVDPGEILVLTGPPAAGKSTVATLIAGQWDLSVHLQADYFQVECIRSGYLKPWKPESHAQNTTVARVFTSATAEYAKGGYSVVLEGIVGPWFVELVAETFAGHRVAWHYAILLPTHDTTLERNRSRSHSVEQEILDKLHGEFTSHINGYQKHVVDSTHLDAGQTAEAVYKKMEAGELRVR